MGGAKQLLSIKEVTSTNRGGERRTREGVEQRRRRGGGLRGEEKRREEKGVEGEESTRKVKTCRKRVSSRLLNPTAPPSSKRKFSAA